MAVKKAKQVVENPMISGISRKGSPFTVEQIESSTYRDGSPMYTYKITIGGDVVYATTPLTLEDYAAALK